MFSGLPIPGWLTGRRLIRSLSVPGLLLSGLLVRGLLLSGLFFLQLGRLAGQLSLALCQLLCPPGGLPGLLLRVWFLRAVLRQLPSLPGDVAQGIFGLLLLLHGLLSFPFLQGVGGVLHLLPGIGPLEGSLLSRELLHLLLQLPLLLSQPVQLLLSLACILLIAGLFGLFPQGGLFVGEFFGLLSQLTGGILIRRAVELPGGLLLFFLLAGQLLRCLRVVQFPAETVQRIGRCFLGLCVFFYEALQLRVRFLSGRFFAGLLLELLLFLLCFAELSEGFTFFFLCGIADAKLFGLTDPFLQFFSVLLKLIGGGGLPFSGVRIGLSGDLLLALRQLTGLISR